MTDKNYDNIKELPVIDMTIGDIVDYLDIIAVRKHDGNGDVQRSVSEIKTRFMMDALYNFYISENKGNTPAEQQIVLRAEGEEDTDKNDDEMNDGVIDIVKYGYWKSVVMGLKQIKRDFLLLYENPTSFPFYLYISEKTLIKTSYGELTVTYNTDSQTLIFSIRLLDETYSTSFDAEYQGEPHIPYTNIEFWLIHKDNIIAKFDELIKQVKERH